MRALREHFTGAWGIMEEQYGILTRKEQDIKACYMVV